MKKAAFVKEQQIKTFFVTSVDATACVKSTNYDLRKIPEMLA